MFRVLTFKLDPVEPLYCAKPVEFLSVSNTADGAPEELVVKETVYDPAAVLLQLTVALPDEVETFPVVPSIVAITHGLLFWTYAVVASFVELSAVAGVGALGVPVKDGLASGA